MAFRTGRPPPEPSPLAQAFARAIAWEPPAQAARLDDAAIAALVAEEARYGRVDIGPNGLPLATTPHLLAGARDLLRQWRAVRNRFDTELEPKRADLNAIEHLDAQLIEAAAESRQKCQRVETVWLGQSENARIQHAYQEATTRLRDIKHAYNNELPTMLAYYPGYWIALLLIGVAEWLINYDVFLLFTGIPAIAAGATIILGVLLAFAAHATGEILRQWSYRFDRARPPDERAGSLRLLALAIIALLVVLAAAGGSRYAAVLRTVAGQSGENILGRAAMIDVDPLRDVLLSLLANFAAWIVGVFIAFYCHDRDPGFMKAQRQFDRARRLLRRRRRRVERELESLEAGIGHRAEELRRAAHTRWNTVAPERDMLAQIDKHEASLTDQITAEARANAEQFRALLCRTALERPNDLHLMRGDAPLTPTEYRAMPLDIEAALQGTPE